MTLRKSRKSESDNDLPLEIPMDVWYSPYIQRNPYIQTGVLKENTQ